MTLETVNEVWEQVLANSFSGLQNSKIICRVGLSDIEGEKCEGEMI